MTLQFVNSPYENKHIVHTSLLFIILNQYFSLTANNLPVSVFCLNKKLIFHLLVLILAILVVTLI